jgi:hypothetical protein
VVLVGEGVQGCVGVYNAVLFSRTDIISRGVPFASCSEVVPGRRAASVWPVPTMLLLLIQMSCVCVCT